ncbi:MAG: caspase family protein [Clostridia bacterium]|nr:caspase family protein [Clostridia bacterium]
MKRLAMLMLTLALCLLCLRALAEDAPVRRALLVGCDSFVSHEDISPSATSNVERMARLLDTDARGYEVVLRMDAGVGGAQQLAAAIEAAFYGAEEGDVSLLYICTHGMYDRISYEPLLAVSDGKTEENITASWLRDALERIPGQKILILDACNSGAFIGKGALDDRAANAFAGTNCQVLTSAGAYENSFLWHDRASLGGGYFTQELCEGLRSHAYDLNADGEVTLSELYGGLLECHGASTPQIYPQQSDAVWYAYDPLSGGAGERPLDGLVLDSAVMRGGEDTLYFSFTVRRPVRVQYQIIYYRGGEWRFDAPQIIEDAENADGALSPGRKQRSVTLERGEESPYGYVLLQVVAQEGRYAMLAGSRLIAVQPDEGLPLLRLRCADSFAPDAGEELSILVRHALPCSLTVRVLDGDGALVRRLAYKTPSRPNGTAQEASFFYWDGRNEAGEMAPAGLYTIEVSTVANGRAWRIRSGQIRLAEEQ